MITHLGHAKEFGIEIGELKTDMAQAVKRSPPGLRAAGQGDRLPLQEEQGDARGRARPPGRQRQGGGHRQGREEADGPAKHIILATGSRPRDLPFLKIDHDRVWDSTDAMIPKETPKTLAVVGAGAIGCEFADVYAAFGTKVTIIEALDRMLPLEDRDCSAVVEKSYRKRGMEVYTGARLEKADIGKDGVTLTVKTAKGETKTIEAERVLSAIGRAPNVEDIGLEKAG
jgi:dihydrolipoamide dehydrogenase